MKPFLFAVTIVLFFIFSSSNIGEAKEYNSSCIFTPRIELINIDLDMFGIGDYSSSIIEGGRANYTVKISTVGNWSQYNIQHMTDVFCDGETKITGEWLKPKTYRNSNGTIMTDFLDENTFSISEGKKYCHIDLSKIYAINQTWEKESGCDRNINDCLCYIDGLSGIPSKRTEKKVLTKDEYQAMKANKTAQDIANQQSAWNLISSIIGALIGGSFIFLGTRLSYRQDLKKKIIEEVYFPLNRELDNIENEIASFDSNGLHEKSSWNKIFNTCSDYWIPKKLRDRLNTFYEKKIPSFRNQIIIFDETIRSIIENELKKAKKQENTKEEFFKNIVSSFILRWKGDGKIIGEKDYDIDTKEQIEDTFNEMKSFYDFSSKNIHNYVNFIDYIKDILVSTEANKKFLEDLYKMQEELIKEIMEIKNNIRGEAKIRFVYNGLKE